MHVNIYIIIIQITAINIYIIIIKYDITLTMSSFVKNPVKFCYLSL